MNPSPELLPVTLSDSRLAFIVDNMPDAEIRPSCVHGNGLFASHELVAGDVLGELDGQRVDWESHDRMRALAPYGEHSNDLFTEWNALSADTLLVRPFRTKYSFINHDRRPNAALRHDPLRVVVIRDVARGEELTLDYRREPLNDDYLAQADFL